MRPVPIDVYISSAIMSIPCGGKKFTLCLSPDEIPWTSDGERSY